MLLEEKIGLSRKTIIEIFEEFVKNSDAYVKEVIIAFEDTMYEMLSKDGLIYKKVDDFYEFSNVFMDTIEGYDLEDTKRGLYSAEQWDSDIERKFINCADRDFKFFTKLSRRFKRSRKMADSLC